MADRKCTTSVRPKFEPNKHPGGLLSALRHSGGLGNLRHLCVELATTLGARR